MPANVKSGQSMRFQEFQQGRKLPQWAITVHAGTGAMMLSAIERCGYKPGVELQERITTALGVNVDNFWPEVRRGRS